MFAETKISVCIATHNGEKYVHDQLKSILNQLSENDEIIISDDSSTDNTVEVIESINDSRIKILRDQKFHSPIYNFENAIRHSRGKFIFLCDQDDIWLPSKVETIMPYFNNHDLVLHDCILVNESLSVINDSYFKINHSKPGLLHNLYKNSYIGCCMAFRRQVWEKCCPFPKNIPMHDLWLGLVGEIFFSTKFIPNKLLLYRRHSLNSSSTGTKSNNTLMKKVSNRIRVSSLLTFLWIKSIVNI